MHTSDERLKKTILGHTAPGGGPTLKKAGTILVVEDNLDDFRLLELALKRAAVPAEFRHVLDGSQALRYLMGEGDYGDRSKNPLPHFILSDLKMPRMDGLELLKWVRAHPPTRRTPFILLSSSNQPNDVARAYDYHANSYLFKPGSLAELSEMLQVLVTYWVGLSQLAEHHDNGQMTARVG